MIRSRDPEDWAPCLQLPEAHASVANFKPSVTLGEAQRTTTWKDAPRAAWDEQSPMIPIQARVAGLRP